MRPFVLALLLVVAAANPALAQSVAGRYRVNGTNPNGSTYGGTAEITPQGQTCRIVWQVGSVWDGICMQSGNTFAAAYRSDKAVGLVIYRLQPDGSLSGDWTLAGASGRGTESLTPER